MLDLYCDHIDLARRARESAARDLYAAAVKWEIMRKIEQTRDAYFETWLKLKNRDWI